MANREIIIKRGGFGSLFSGFLIGGLIGAGVALLSAPQSGAETRALLGDRANQWRDRAMVAASDTRDRAGKAISTARDQANDVISRTKDRASNVVHKSSDVIEQTKSNAQDMGNTGSM